MDGVDTPARKVLVLYLVCLAMCKIPEELLSTAYFSHDEPAWPRAAALAVIEWATASHIAVLGGEIWLPTTPGPTIPTPYIYAFETTQNPGESWDLFVRRANGAATTYVAAFEWDLNDETHQFSTPFFNLTLADE